MTGAGADRAPAAPVTRPVSTPAALARDAFDLVIAIPTFNRAAQLGTLLEQLRVETAPVSGRVLIAVSNNGSSDGTSALLARYAAAHPEIAFESYNQPHDIGVIPNIHFLVTVARGTWTWCMADDDLLVEGGLRAVLDALTGVRGDLLLVRTLEISEWDAVPRGVRLREVTAASPEGARLLFASGFLASVLMRSAVWRRLRAEAEAFDVPNYANWAAAMLAAAEAGQVAFLDTPIVRGNATMVGAPRYAIYPATLQRLAIWRRFHDAGGERAAIAAWLRPHIVRLFSLVWKSVVAGEDRSLVTRRQQLHGFRQGVALLGITAVRASPWLAIAICVPYRARRALNRWRRRW